jgi:hypothetical protein
VSEIVNPTGRRMTKQLEAALDNAQDRKLLIKGLQQPGGSFLGALHEAIALELQLVELRAQEESRYLESVYEADATGPPMPEATGDPWTDDAA